MCPVSFFGAHRRNLPLFSITRISSLYSSSLPLSSRGRGRDRVRRDPQVASEAQWLRIDQTFLLLRMTHSPLSTPCLSMGDSPPFPPRPKNGGAAEGGPSSSLFSSFRPNPTSWSLEKINSLLLLLLSPLFPQWIHHFSEGEGRADNGSFSSSVRLCEGRAVAAQWGGGFPKPALSGLLARPIFQKRGKEGRGLCWC